MAREEGVLLIKTGDMMNKVDESINTMLDEMVQSGILADCPLVDHDASADEYVIRLAGYVVKVSARRLEQSLHLFLSTWKDDGAWSDKFMPCILEPATPVIQDVWETGIFPDGEGTE